MKTKLLLLFIILSFTAVSQIKWAPAGAEWYYNYSTAGNNPLADYEKFEIIKDTVVDDKLCKIIGSKFSSEIMYEEDGKVFYRFKDDFKLIYDFTANVGDTIEFELKSFSPNSFVIDTTYKIYSIVTNIQSEVIDDTEVKKFYTTVLKNDTIISINHVLWPDYYNYQERIGYEERFVPIISIPTTTDSHHTLRCYQDSAINYSTDWWKLQNKPCDYRLSSSLNQIEFDELNIFPNPVSIELNISHNLNTSFGKFRVELRNCMGYLLYNDVLATSKHNINVSDLPNGLYFLTVFNSLNYKNFKIIKL